jgi:glycosyltransferase involved in cell wall biosynthesis
VRIVHVTDSFAPRVGGIERQVEALARHQRAEGHDVHVVTAVSDVANIDLPVTRTHGRRWLTTAFPWRHAQLVGTVLDAAPVDVVHAHYTIVSPLPEYVARAASRRGIPVGITVHSLWWQIATATRVSNVPFGVGRAQAAWSAVSSVAAEHVLRTLPRLGEVSVVPNLVDTDWWRPADPIRPTGQDELRLALVGRLVKRKHVREFLDALALARPGIVADNPGVRLRVRIVGDGPRRDDLSAQVAELGLGDWIEFLGHRPPAEIRQVLQTSDLFVATSRQESFGIAALEARAAGLPVLGFRGNGLADFIADEAEGRLVDDHEELSLALGQLLGAPGELDQLRKTTTAFGPSVGVEQAMDAVRALYARAASAARR